MQPVQEGVVSDIGRRGVLLPRASPASEGEAADCRYRDRSDEPRGQHNGCPSGCPYPFCNLYSQRATLYVGAY